MDAERVAREFCELSGSGQELVRRLVNTLSLIEAITVPGAAPDGHSSGKPGSRIPGNLQAAEAHRRLLGKCHGAIDSSLAHLGKAAGMSVYTVPPEYRGPYKRRAR
jgi:hypothetical protein